jgi:hypothetical protein
LTALTAHPTDQPGVEVDDRREVELPRRGQQLGRVAHPALVRGRGLERAVEQVVRDRLVVVAHRRRAVPPTNASYQALALHEPDHPIAANVLTREVRVHPRAAVGLSASGERLADQHLEPLVLPGARRGHAPQPGVEARGRDLEHGTHHRHRPAGPLRQDEREPHAFSFAKKASIVRPGQHDMKCGNIRTPNRPDRLGIAPFDAVPLILHDTSERGQVCSRAACRSRRPHLLLV